MASIAEIRAQYPQYEDMSDPQLADALYAKYYSDMPRSDFLRKVGMSDAYVDALESAGAKQLKGSPGKRPETYDESYFAQGASGFNEGLAGAMGLPVDAATWALNLGIRGANTAFGSNLPEITRPIGGSQMFGDLMGAAIKPETDDSGKQFLRRTMQDFGAAATPMGLTASVAARPASLLAKEALLTAGTGAGAATAETLFPGNPIAEMTGQVLGGLGAGGAMKVARKAVTPLPNVSAERRAAVETMRREGVPLTAGQQTGSKRLQYFEGELGGARIADINESQAEQFTRAALSRAGISGRRATPEVMDQAFTRIGQEFDGLAARNALIADQQMVGDIGSVWNDYANLVNPSSRAPIIENVIRDISAAIRNNGGTIGGEAYQSLRSRIERAARGTKDPELADALRGLKGALDDAMERSIGQHNPGDLGAWQQVRSDYRNILVLEKAAQTGGEAAALGLISPAQLRMATQQVYGKRSYVRGRDAFAELAQAGQATMTPLPQSGTAPRLTARPKHLMNPLNWIDSLAAGAVLSGPGRRYLANQVLPRRAPDVSALPVPITNIAAGQNLPRRPVDITIYGGR